MRRWGFAAVLLGIVAVGAAWLVWDIATDDDPGTDGGVYQRIDAYVADQMADSRIPGLTLAIVDDGNVVHCRGFGNDGNGNPVTADTPFPIGSNTKSITALAIMQLVETGRIDLDRPVQEYLPDFAVADPEASAAITVRHLLNQTSGTSRIDGLKAVISADDQSIAEVVADMADLELNRPVGETFEYANLNSVALGAVIEAVTGQTWAEYVEANIFDPLAMNRTYTDKEAAEADGLTATHRSFFGYAIESGVEHQAGLLPTGYVYSTANDMARYLSAYTQGGTLDGQRVLGEAGIAEMLAPATNERAFTLQSQEFTARYGAGWFIGEFGAAPDARWHQGSLPEFTAWMMQTPDTGQAAVVLINEGNQFEIGGANAAWSRIPQGVVNLMRGDEPPTGIGASRFFIVFITLVAVAITLQAGALARIARRPIDPHLPMWRALAPLLWEVVGAGLLLIAYPGITGGLGWGAAFRFLPDLSLTVLVIALLALATGVTRIVRLVRARQPGTTPLPT